VQEGVVTTLTAPAPHLRDTEAHGLLEGGGVTLLERLDLVWEGARAEGTASCPVCHGGMAPAGETVRCEDCGAELD
jgi:tRNA(Ile2) C34 agmatinyltransferase TiaS